MKDKLNELLYQNFGHTKLKKEQYKIIKNILNGNDVCAVLPTGFGKSVCYQLPFLYTHKSVIVVSPLISLIEDQVKQLKKMNIPVCALDSSNKNKTISLREIFNGENKIIFSTPEYLALNDKVLRTLEEKKQLALIAIDESHCVSNWGNDFRPSYKKLSCLRDFIPNTPILALTATATDKIQQDICKILRLNDPVFITGSFDRPNLYISVSERNKNTFDIKIKSLLKIYKGQKVLIYCRSRNECDSLAKEIKSLGYKCKSYHARKTDRSEIQSDFTNGELDCIVATIAFGLGINIPDIRLVIHYNCPSDLESYYQEIGRAGRDGEKSECYLFYSSKDFLVSRRFLNSIENTEFKKYKEKELKYMQKFVMANMCRRSILLEHFDKEYDLEECDNCDFCCKPKTKKIDYSKEAKLFLKILIKINKTYGIGIIVKIIRGSQCKQVLGIKYLIEEFMGKGKSYSEQWWKAFANQLQVNGYIAETKLENAKSKFTGTVIKITSKGREWYRNRDTEKMMLDFDYKINTTCNKMTFKDFYTTYIKSKNLKIIDQLNHIIENIKII